MPKFRPIPCGCSVSRPDQQADSIARNTLFAVAVKLTGIVFTGILTIFLVRYLRPREYGVFALALGVGAQMTVPSDLGISMSAARFAAELRGDARAVAQVVSDALRLKLVVGGLSSLGLIVLAGPIASAYGLPGLAWPLRILALAVFGQSLMLFWATIFEALGRISVYLRVVVAESAIEAGVSIAIVLLGTGASGAMAGRAAAYAFAAGFGLALITRTLGRSVRPRRAGHGHARRIAVYGSALALVDGAFTLFSTIDVLLIGAILSVSAVGLFQAAYTLAGLLLFIGAPVRSAVAPRLSRGADGPDHEALETALRYMVLVQGVVLAPLIVWAEPLIRIVLGTDYLGAVDTLRVLAPFALLATVSPVLAGSANYLGAAARRVPIAITTVVVDAAIDVALLHRIGIVAAAIATDVAYALYVGAHLRLCRDVAGLRIKPLAAPFLGSLAAAGGMALVLLVFGTSEIPVALVVVGAVLGTAVYAAILLATRQVTLDELKAVRRRRPARDADPAHRGILDAAGGPPGTGWGAG
jgi:O-antigen/teichoic acid export membrane protein